MKINNDIIFTLITIIIILTFFFKKLMILKDLICKKCHHIWKAICKENKIEEIQCRNCKRNWISNTIFTEWEKRLLIN